MNIVVLCKQVPDTESKIKLLDDQSGFAEADIKWVLNPYDEFAVEEALKLREAGKAEKVIAVAAGPKRAEDALITALAMGADEAVLVEDDLFNWAEAYQVAQALAAALKEVDFQLIICGKQAVDDDSAAVPGMLAELTNIGQMTVVSKMELNDDTVTGWRDVEGGAQEVLEGKLPLIVTANRGLNEPRYASLPGIMKAKRKPFKRVGLADIGLSSLEPKTKVVGWSLPEPRAEGKMFEGNSDDLPQRVSEVVKLLVDEAKVL